MKQLRRIPLSLVALLFLFVFSSCGPESAAPGSAANVSATPVSEIDALLNSYEKTVKDYLRVARQHQNGDVSVTMRFIEMKDKTRAAAAQVQQQVGKMSPPQRQRLANLNARLSAFPLD